MDVPRSHRICASGERPKQRERAHFFRLGDHFDPSQEKLEGNCGDGSGDRLCSHNLCDPAQSGTASECSPAFAAGAGLGPSNYCGPRAGGVRRSFDSAGKFAHGSRCGESSLGI